MKFRDRFRQRLKGLVRNILGVPYAPRTPGMVPFAHRTDSTAQLAAYGSVGTLFAIVRTISVAVARVNWRLYRKQVDARRATPGPDRERQEVIRHAVLDLWNAPNPFMTGMYFRQACQQHLELVGETTIVVVRSPLSPLPLELWPVRPDRMVPLPHPTEFLAGWVYIGPNGEKIPLGIDDVIQIKFPNPLDPYRGLGPLQAALLDVHSAQYAADWNRNFFLNSAEPGGILETDQSLEDDEFDKLELMWRETHQGVNNAHRVAILENGLKWRSLEWSPRDMQFAQLRGVSRELIREAWTIHGHMLGISQDVNKANAYAGESSFAKWLVVPRADDWKDTLNTRLLRMFQADTVEFDHDRVVPEDREADDRERTSKANAAAVLANTGVWEPDDILRAMELPDMRTVPQPAPEPVDPGGETNPDRALPEGRSSR